MIYLFTGNNPYTIKQELLRWKSGFESKFWADNIIHFTTLEAWIESLLVESLTSFWLFWSKRLVIIESFPFSWERQFAWANEIEKKILDCLEHIPEDIIVIFAAANPDKRKAAFKSINKVSEIKDFSISSYDEIYNLLSQKYSQKIRSEALKKLIFLKWESYEKSLWEIEKLLISHDSITSELVEENVRPEFEQSIFIFIDEILNKDSKKIFSSLHTLLNNSNIYALHQSIVANLRVFLYINFLKETGKTAGISDVLSLWKRSFLLNKRYKANFWDIKKLYDDLLSFDKHMKTWKFLSSDEAYLIQQLEKGFINYLQ